MSHKFSITIKFSLLIAGILVLAFGLFFWQFEKNQRADLHAVMGRQAKNIFRHILITREWNSLHGGVYVRKAQGIETNPYLAELAPDLDPEIRDQDGNIYTLRNPALMTREISLMAEKAGLVRYRLTSLDPVNPANAPTAEEAAALQKFVGGRSHVAEILRAGDRHEFFYMAPLFAEEECLSCHRSYQPGEVRGAISLFLPMDAELEIAAARRKELLSSGILLLLLALGGLVLGSRILVIHPIGQIREFAAKAMGRGGALPASLLRRRDEIGHLARYLQEGSDEIGNYRQGLEKLVEDRTHELQEAKEQLEQLSRTDPLTGLGNRRHLELETPRIFALAGRRQLPVSVLLVDIDRFKRLNDNHGHKAGDQVLVNLGKILVDSIRPYDLAIRFGGEEFLLLLNCAKEDGWQMAERIRCKVAETPLVVNGKSIPMTISVGVSTAAHASELETVLKQADDALYRAKQEGRNRTRIFD